MAVQPVYLIGPPRTGTTLLIFLLAGGDRTIGLSEPSLAHAIMPPWKLHRHLYQFQVTCGTTRIAAPWHCNYNRFMGFLFQVARSNRMQYVVIKETFRTGDALTTTWRNEQLMNEIVTGNASTILLIRHPYDAISSSIRLFRWALGLRGWLIRRRWPTLPRFGGTQDIVRWAATNWARFVTWSREQDLDLLRYEDLVTEPGPHLQRVCARLSLPFDERMLDHLHPRPAFWGIGAPEVLLRKPRPVSRQSIGRGHGMCEEYKHIIRSHCADVAGGLGYDLT